MLRLLGGCVVITLLAAGASATSFFEAVGIVVDGLKHGVVIKSADLLPPGAGAPQTFLILGDDSRAESHDVFDKADPAHSDTILLVRIDPKLGQTTVMSVPRDLEVSYYAQGQEYSHVKINQAFQDGGPTTSLRVIKKTLGLPINNIVVINFQTFADIVDDLGCVYIDVDHHYYIPSGTGVAAIDIDPGYQPLCGFKALSYVRFRHTDSTFARDAREQDFLRQAKQQLGVGALLNNPAKLFNDLGHQVSTNIHSYSQVIRLAEIAESAVGGPVRQVKFPDTTSVGPGGEDFQTATPSQIHDVVNNFLYGTTGATLPVSVKHHHHHHHVAPAVPAGLTATSSFTSEQAAELSVNVPFRVDLPSLAYVYGTQPDVSDFYAYKVRVPKAAADGGLVYHGYRITWDDADADGGYYGIEGINWTDPPLFHGAPTDRIDGRRYMFVTDGTAYHDIGWIDGKELYWVSNTIFDNLNNAQMLAIAESASSVG
jgi:LCP family protein required for cell wall assembly